MSVEITAATVENLSKKLEAFSNTLNDEERTLFAGMLDGHGLTDEALAQVAGGRPLVVTTGRFSTPAPKLNQRFFNQLMCW
jgi:hypothetical protein